MPTTTSPNVPYSVEDPINRQILAVSEDRIAGFTRTPLEDIAKLSGVALDTVIQRIDAMLRHGTIRRVRQTLLTTSLAPGALIAWQVPPKNLLDAFDYMSKQDPFSGHVVLRTTDKETPGSAYKLWTTLKVPVGYAMEKHCQLLMEKTGATRFKLLPAKKLFALGVGHVRRKEIEPGARTDEPGRVLDTTVVELNGEEWNVLMSLKRELDPEELAPNLWAGRAQEAGVSLETFCTIAESLAQRKLIGRFSTFLEHVKKHKDGSRVTRFNALFHWRVPEGKEMEAGIEVGRHHCMTHAYWREGGEEFSNVNIMGVSHGTDKDKVLEHKAAIDQHLEEAGIKVEYTNVFWGGKSEIKPSEIAPQAYADWCRSVGVDPEAMRA
ncbi:MAG: Lrp/AsnC family transcriptional regulator [Phycisphaerales bacterium JB063]